jgi:signal transduction histidine kinase
MLRAQRTRSQVLAAVFGGAAVILLAGEGVERLVGGSTRVPVVVLPFILILSLQQLLLARLVTRRIDLDVEVPERFWLASAFLEVTLITCVIGAMSPSVLNPVYALIAPAVFAYFIFIIFSTLHLEPRICVFTGAVASIEFLALAFIILGLDTSAATLPMLVGSRFPYLMKAILLFGAGVGAAFVARQLRSNIEHSIAAHRERDRVAAADRAKTTFLAHMSHEIRAPLNAVLGYAEILTRDSSLTTEQHHAVATIGSSGDHLLSVVNQVLDLSRIEAGHDEAHVRAFDLTRLVADLSAMFALRCARKDLAWHVRTFEQPERVLGDPDRMRQVLINLLDNAVRMTSHGSISLEVTRNGDHVRCAVVDTGPGIPADLIATVFEPFTQGSARDTGSGSGLGLAIARAQAEVMNGTLRLERSGPAGSRFVLELQLPYATGDVGAEHDAVMRLSPRVTIRAMVIDDTDQDRDVLVRMLNVMGLTVCVSAGGDSLASRIHECRPDIVFLDAGLQTAAPVFADERRSDYQVVAISASALAHERESILNRGFDAFLAKPIRSSQIATCIRSLTGAEFECDEADPRAQPLVAKSRPLPRALWLHLRAAAEAYSITDLKQGLDELAELGGDMHVLSENLRHLSRTYDMERIVDVLDEVHHV